MKQAEKDTALDLLIAFRRDNNLHDLPINDQVKFLIDTANTLQGEICDNADKIKIDMFEEASQYTSLDLKRGDWVYMVSTKCSQKYANITEKRRQKILDDQENANYKNALWTSFHQQTLLGDDGTGSVSLPVIDDEDRELKFTDKVFAEKGFNEMLDEAADLRNYINTKLWPRMSEYSSIFGAMTDFKFGGWTFKLLLDAVHYEYGGYPSETSPPKIWGAFNRYRNVVEALEQFDFPHAKEWNKRFGLNVTMTEKHATWTTFNEYAQKFVDFEIKAFTKEAINDDHNEHLETIVNCQFKAKELFFVHCNENDTVIFCHKETYQIVGLQKFSTFCTNIKDTVPNETYKTITTIDTVPHITNILHINSADSLKFNAESLEPYSSVISKH